MATVLHKISGVDKPIVPSTYEVFQSILHIDKPTTVPTVPTYNWDQTWVSRAGTSNYIHQYPLDAIIYPRPRHMLPVQHSRIIKILLHVIKAQVC